MISAANQNLVDVANTFFVSAKFVAFDFKKFQRSDHKFIRKISDFVWLIVEIIISFNFSSFKSSNESRTITTIKFFEFLKYSADWVFDVNIFRNAIKIFRKDTLQFIEIQIYRSFLKFKSINFSNKFSSNSFVTSASTSQRDSLVFSKDTSEILRKIKHELISFFLSKNRSFSFEISSCRRNYSVEQLKTSFNHNSSIIITTKRNTIEKFIVISNIIRKTSIEKTIYDFFIESKNRMTLNFVIQATIEITVNVSMNRMFQRMNENINRRFVTVDNESSENNQNNFNQDENNDNND